MSIDQKSIKWDDAPDPNAVQWDIAPPVSERQRLLANPAMRLARGMKDPIEGAAQLAARANGAGFVNAAADAVGGFLNRNVFNTPTFNRMIGVPETTRGDFAGEVLGIRGMTPEQIDADTRGGNAEYEAARKATGQSGIDAMRLAGNIVSPVNAPIARMVPVAKAGASLGNVALKGAAAGAAGAATQPVMGENFAAEKLGQVAMGAAGGAVLSPLVSKISEAVGRTIQNYRRLGSVNISPEGLRIQITRQLEADGISADQIPKHIFDRLNNDVAASLATGKTVDPATLLREADFKALGIPALRGQLTRNPAQYTREYNLAGVEGIGEPLQAVMAQQSRGIQGRLDRASAGPDTYAAGEKLIALSQAMQRKRDAGVRQAYDAFRQATGRELEVPLQGLAQDYAATLREFGDAIPGSVRRQFEDLGLLTGKQLKALSIEDAERLIKTINRNTDPKNTVAYRALGDLRGAIQSAISSAADGDTAGTVAAKLAREARGAAAENFRTLEAIPGLKAAVEGVEPDKFVQKYVLGGNVNEIAALANQVGPEGRQAMAAQLAQHLRSKAFGANAAGDGKAAQAAFNSELNRIGRAKLETILGKEGADEMQRIGRVLAYIKQVPEGATPNTSGTGQMLTSVLGKARGIKGLPYVNDWIVQPLVKYGDRQEVQRALQGAPKTAAELDPATEEALRRLFAPLPVGAGAALGYSVR